MRVSPVLTLCTALVIATGLAAASDTPLKGASPSVVKVVLASEVQWEPLNPARGDASPKAGTLWGDRKRAVATGFLVQFAEGFSSPPHIHNVSYRGVVISGHVHNDDPEAAPMWMPPGSFWTQPRGEAHITAASAPVNVAYIEIEGGPYLVHPAAEAFDSGERPVNVDPSNIVWLDASSTAWIGDSGSEKGAEVAFLWGSPKEGQSSGSFIRLPAGGAASIESRGSSFRAVVIQGQPTLVTGDGAKVLPPGSYFSSTGGSVHRFTSGSAESILYVRAKGTFKVNPTRPGK